jgi:hypothetical protein
MLYHIRVAMLGSARQTDNITYYIYGKRALQINCSHAKIVLH